MTARSLVLTAALAVAAALPGGAAAAPPLRATLHVTYWAHGQAEGSAVAVTVHCPGPGAACRALAADPAALGAAQRPRALMLIRGTPQARFVGGVAGRRIDRMLNPACDRAAWVALQPLVRPGP